MNAHLVAMRVLGCLFIACAGLITALTVSIGSVKAETPLESYRRALRSNDFESVNVPGWVIKFETPNTALLSLSTMDLQAAGVNSLDLVFVAIGTQKLHARTLTSASYNAARNPDRKVAPESEADSYLIFDPADPHGFVRLVGTGSSLVEAVKGAEGMRIDIHLKRVRATPAAKFRSGG